MKIKPETHQLLASGGLILVALLYAQQDIWIAKLVKNLDPLAITLWNFLVVLAVALAMSVRRLDKFQLPRSAWPDMLGLNVSTFTTWIFTFFALQEGSPAVVAAATLSAPLLMRLVLFEKNHRRKASTYSFFAPMIIGLVVGATESNSATRVQSHTLIYCFLASLGVLGNSLFMKRLHSHSVSGESVVFYRFLLLVSSLAAYFLLQTGSLPKLDLPTNQLIALAMITSYAPLVLLYYVHRHLEIITINVLLALTPVFTIGLLVLGGGAGVVNRHQLISVVLILFGVLAGYRQTLIRTKEAL